MTILYGFKLDPQGRVMDRLFDHDKMPPDWVDSPDKLPGKNGEVVPVQPDVKRRGRPVGSRNRVTHG